MHSSSTSPRIPGRAARLFTLLLLGVSALTAPRPEGAVAALASAAADPDARRHGEWIEQMKSAPRGPFRRLRWFCADGTVHPPKPYPCKERGGGVQHGELNDQAVALRKAGYQVANVLADLDADALLAEADHQRRLTHMLIERFLQEIDDGWILRKARFYRGALQEEDERDGARRLLLALSRDDRRLDREFVVVRSAARLFPHGAPSKSANLVRQLSADLSDRDPGFLRLRNKIHVQPGPDDARAVREYASKVSDAALLVDYNRLAEGIDRLYGSAETAKTLRALARRGSKHATLPDLLNNAAAALEANPDPSKRFHVLAGLLAELRETFTTIKSTNIRIALMDASLLAEADLFATATRIRPQVDGFPRAEQLALLASTVDAIFGSGLLTVRERVALEIALSQLDMPSVKLDLYKSTLDYLARVPSWSSRRLRYHFGDGMDSLSRIEPKAARFMEDALRGSPLFFFAHIIDRLTRDANSLAGVSNELAGQAVGSALRALNPGLARGTLLRAPKAGEDFDSTGIYILPETESDLPPVAGILTAGQGNPLSHVQLLARNLGIPNVGVDEALLPRLDALVGKQVLLAVSAAGSVRLVAATTEHDALFKKQASADQQSLIRPDLDKLNLEEQRLLTLSDLRADDSGRTVGPKAAKLGELKHSFPDAVAEGLAIPFGVFKSLLDRPHENSGQSVFEWMQHSYRTLEALPAGSARRQAETEAFRAQLYDWVLNARPDEEFKSRLRKAMGEVFGRDGSYGVFVRSDTNVEDLPGFTGAGLNLTVANVVGVDAVLAAIPRVWASPFTARAFAWRQNHMDTPEHVYPAVLLLRSVNAEKSGVLVTQDIDTGSDAWLSVAVNEGVGGAVDGQAAESLRIAADGSGVRLLSQATATIRRRINPKGGVTKIPATGSDYVLLEPEVQQLVELKRVLPQRFPAISDVDGRAAPADIEFGFLDSKLQLFQIRPFLESRQARGNAYLNSLDARMKDLTTIEVLLSETPS